MRRLWPVKVSRFLPVMLLIIFLTACGNQEKTPTGVPVVTQANPSTAAPAITNPNTPTVGPVFTQRSTIQTSVNTAQSKTANPAIKPTAIVETDLTAVRSEKNLVKSFTDNQGRTIKLVYGRGSGHKGDYGWAHILGKHINGIWYDGGTITTFPKAVGAKTPEAVIDLIAKSLTDKTPTDQDGGRLAYIYPVSGTKSDIFTVVGSDGTIITSYPVPHGSKEDD